MLVLALCSIVIALYYLGIWKLGIFIKFLLKELYSVCKKVGVYTQYLICGFFFGDDLFAFFDISEFLMYVKVTLFQYM